MAPPTPRVPTAAVEQAAATVTKAIMTSPQGNANDPVEVSLGNDPALDLTQATLTASASKGVVATLSGPSIGALPPPDATNGASFFVAWLSNTGGKVIVYYARANESPARHLDVHLRSDRHLRAVEHVRRTTTPPRVRRRAA